MLNKVRIGCQAQILAIDLGHPEFTKEFEDLAS